MASTSIPMKPAVAEPGQGAREPARLERLSVYQVCFVVDEVERAAAECSERFGWGPFRCFRATVDNLDYRGRPARRVADVALGMAGRVQVELLHVHDGVDCLAVYQARHGRGFQHLGIDTPCRESTLARLEGLGARLDHRDEFEGIRIAFVDVPSGPGAFELVDRTSGAPSGAGATLPEPGRTPRISIDRATLVTDRMDATLDFFGKAFGWQSVVAEPATLRWEASETRLLRALGPAGRLEIELVEGRPGGRDPYSRHLARSGPGLVHAGGLALDRDAPESFADRWEASRWEASRWKASRWKESAEEFVLLDWSGGAGALQLRAR